MRVNLDVQEKFWYEPESELKTPIGCPSFTSVRVVCVQVRGDGGLFLVRDYMTLKKFWNDHLKGEIWQVCESLATKLEYDRLCTKLQEILPPTSSF